MSPRGKMKANQGHRENFINARAVGPNRIPRGRDVSNIYAPGCVYVQPYINMRAAATTCAPLCSCIPVLRVPGKATCVALVCFFFLSIRCWGYVVSLSWAGFVWPIVAFARCSGCEGWHGAGIFRIGWLKCFGHRVQSYTTVQYGIHATGSTYGSSHFRVACMKFVGMTTSKTSFANNQELLMILPIYLIGT